MASTRSLLGLAVIALVLTGCAPSAAPPASPAMSGPPPAAGAVPAAKSAVDSAGRPIKIGFLVKQPEESWFQDEWKFARRCAEDNGFEVITNGSRDGEKILAQIDTLAVQGAQGFVICTPDVKLGPAIVAKAKSHDLKVYAVDDQFVGPDGEFMTDVPYMGISASEIGRAVGQGLYEEWQNWPVEETAVAGITFDELDTAKKRTDGAQAALIEAGFPADRIFTKNERTTDIPGAQDAMSALLTQHGEIKHWLVFSMNDEGVLGAVRALEARGFGADSCAGIGIGGSSSFPELGKATASSFVGTVLISPKRHGYETTEAMFRWIRDGVEPPAVTLTAGYLVYRDNFREIAEREGVLTP